MKVLVTGASGFIGSRLVNDLIQEGHKVSCLVRKQSDCSAIEDLPGVSITRGDIREKKSISSAVKGCKAVIHLAASTSEKASELELSEEVNVGGAKNLIEACEGKVDRLIVISSQSTKRKKKGVYARTKSIADELFLDSDLNVTILKPALVYGPGSKGLFVKIQKLAKALPIIPIIGSGEYKMQPTYVDDLNKGILSCLKNKRTANSTYDIAGGTRLSFNEFVDTICDEAFGKKKKKVKVPFRLTYLGLSILSLVVKNPPVTKDNVLGLVQETKIDLNPAKRDFNYSPRTFRKGLRDSTKVWTSPEEKRIGIVGLGKMGVVHASLVNQIPGSKVVGIMDVKSKLRTYAHSVGISAPFFTNPEDLIKQAEPDAVFICVPPSFNKSLVSTFAEKGIAVLAEKPLAETLSSAEEIVKIVESNKVSNSVGYMLAFSPTFQKARSLLLGGKIGSIERFQANALVSQVFSKQKGWRTSKDIAGGGCVAVHGSHLIYLLNSFLGEANTVSATLSNPYSVNVEDTAEVEITYGKKKGFVFMSWSEPHHKTLDLSLKFFGSKGSLEVTNDHIKLNCGGKRSMINKSEIPTNPEFNIGGDGYYSQNKEFIKSLYGKKSNVVSMREGMGVQKVIDAIYRSAKVGREVKL